MRRPKRNPSTGSVLLGQELRRLRGVRTLDEIAALSVAPPLAGTVPPVSASSISDVETGKQMPKLLTLYTFSMVYRVSMNQLLGYVVEEDLAKAAEGVVATTDEEAESTFTRLLSLGEWHAALALAVQLERMVTIETQRIRWRGNRALCMSRLGQSDAAIAILTSCVESSEITARQRFVTLQMLADMHAMAGSIQTATWYTRVALENLPADASPAEIANLQAIRSDLIITAQEALPVADERAVREALRLTEGSASAWNDDPVALLVCRYRLARGHRLLGNRLLAGRDLELILRESAEHKFSRVEAQAALELARLRRESGRSVQAVELFERARTVAEPAQQYDLVFEACLGLAQLTRSNSPEVAAVHFRRCRELLPVLPASNRAVKEFEKLHLEIA